MAAASFWTATTAPCKPSSRSSAANFPIFEEFPRLRKKSASAIPRLVDEEEFQRRIALVKLKGVHG